MSWRCVELYESRINIPGGPLGFQCPNYSEIIVIDETNFSAPSVQSTGKKSRRRLILELAVGFGILGLVLHFVDFRVLVNTLSRPNPWHFVALLALTHVERALMAYRWRLLLTTAGVQVPFLILFRTYLISPLTAILLPTAIGSDLFKVYVLSRQNVDTRAVAASVIADRVIGLIAMLTLAAVSLGLAFLLLRDEFAHFKEVGFALLIGLVVAGVLVWLALGGFRGAVDSLAGRFTNFRYVNTLHRIYTVYSDYRNHRRVLAVVFAWALLQQLAPILTFLLIAEGLHIDVSLAELIVIVPLLILAIRIFPGLGVQEGLFVVLFGLVGISPAQAFLMAAVGRLASYIPAFLWAIHQFLKERRAAFRELPVSMVRIPSARE